LHGHVVRIDADKGNGQTAVGVVFTD